MIGNLTKSGIEIIIADLIFKYSKVGFNKIKKKFCIRYKSPIGTFYIEKKIYVIQDQIIIFPRFLGNKLLELNIIDQINNKIEDGKSVDINYIGKSNENQETVINYIFSNIYNNKNKINGFCGLTLQLQAGTGKTFCAMDIINRIKQKTLIIVPNTYLLKQWLGLLIQYFPDSSIGQYYGKKKQDGDIVVAIINSLTTDIFTFKEKINKKNIITEKSYKEYYKDFGLVVLDESHIYCTNSFQIIYNRLQSTYMLGLSATPNERSNKCDLISHYNIGEIIDSSKIDNYNVDNTKFYADVHLIKYDGPDEYINTYINPSTQMICVPKIIDDLVSDIYRNSFIIYELFKLFELKLNIFVFSERRSHLQVLYNLFNKYCLLQYNTTYDNNISIPELDINKNIILFGGSSDEDIEYAKNKSNIIFTTYAYSSTGVSINKMNAVILTTPRRSKSRQIIGRIFRLNNENLHIKRIIIDIIDNKTVLKNQLHSRISSYKERECNIIKKNINYSEITLI
jgi:superfamily II DNA or RNA helicase